MWICRLQGNYCNFAEFMDYCEAYGIHERLGYDSPEEAWEDNPVVEGSVQPEDFRVVPNDAILA